MSAHDDGSEDSQAQRDVERHAPLRRGGGDEVAGSAPVRRVRNRANPVRSDPLRRIVPRVAVAVAVVAYDYAELLDIAYVTTTLATATRFLTVNMRITHRARLNAGAA